jgi:hypothetical protein
MTRRGPKAAHAMHPQTDWEVGVMGERAKSRQESPVSLWEDLSHELWQVQIGIGGAGETRLITLDELEAAFKRGEIDAATLVCKPGTQRWKTLGEVTGIEQQQQQQQQQHQQQVDPAEQPDSISPMCTEIEAMPASSSEKKESAKPPPIPRKRQSTVGPLSREELSVARPKIVSAKLISVSLVALIGGALLVARFVPARVSSSSTQTQVVRKAEPAPTPPAPAQPAIAFATPSAAPAPAPAPTPTPAAPPVVAAAAPAPAPAAPAPPVAAKHAPTPTAVAHHAPPAKAKAAPSHTTARVAAASSAHYPWKTPSKNVDTRAAKNNTGDKNKKTFTPPSSTKAKTTK